MNDVSIKFSRYLKVKSLNCLHFSIAKIMMGSWAILKVCSKKLIRTSEQAECTKQLHDRHIVGEDGYHRISHFFFFLFSGIMVDNLIILIMQTISELSHYCMTLLGGEGSRGHSACSVSCYVLFPSFRFRHFTLQLKTIYSFPWKLLRFIYHK